MNFRHTILLGAILPTLVGDLGAAPIDFVKDVRPIFEKHCYSCHAARKQKSGFRLDVKSVAFKGGDGFAPNIVPGKAAESPLIKFVSGADKDMLMPPADAGSKLSPAEVATLTKWVEEGAVWPDGVDRVQLVDPREHWAFKPVTSTQPSTTKRTDWARNDIDRFILARLEHAGLSPSVEAEPINWLRRVTFDLTGLPPTSEELDDFKAAIAGRGNAASTSTTDFQSVEADNRRTTSPSYNYAYAAVVERLLKSPRYGERWAQQWLDVVRYADTHGFEVNTERPNAWPYRDYVIEAFNADTRFDQFIREQLVGDVVGKDSATGFLVTASVLLPGQIGADEPSKRLARQDSLDEIVVNVGQTFLGLSVGCARCHDHKFDPITQRDYYAMQSFFAGVQYADREIRSPQTDARRQAADVWKQAAAKIDRQLAQLVPVARIDATPARATDPKQNVESFEPVVAKFVRFTIHDANLHPTLGLIEPCIDEFEIFSAPIEAGAESKNVALAADGTKVTASGSRTSAIHRIEHINDGQYGNSRSWMSNEHGRGWVQFELPQPTRIGKVVWGRDRLGQFTDRLATAFTLEVGESLDSMKRLAAVGTVRPAVSSQQNVDRFEALKTKRLRFTINATNSLEPCVDEFEIFNLDGINVGLAERGTKVTSSGDNVAADRHELRFVNDGKYGNARSWMSNAIGKGMLEFELPRDEVIDRVVWGRDREGKFKDRLATDYRLEVLLPSGEWRGVAGSMDRKTYSAEQAERSTTTFSLDGLTASDAAIAKKLLAEKQALEKQIAEATTGQLVFAGTFRKPDDIRVLYRGDPEQPKEPVEPAVPAIFESRLSLRESASASNANEEKRDNSTSDDAAKKTLFRGAKGDHFTDEQRRRAAIADWLASPANPLTARVIVNRIWQGHFGTGIVDTPSDFGLNGSKPTHPELLDWLATEFMKSDWSIKRLHRLIVLSSTYRQSSRSNPAGAAQDSDVRLLWRYPSRRLEAEQLRDSMLAVSGRLNVTMYGRGFDLFDKRGGLSGFKPVESFSGEGLKRMIYAHKVRREREAVFGAFDCPDAGQSTGRRRESTTPVQALNLFNSRFTIDESDAFAARVVKEAGGDSTAQIRRAYQLALSREPSVIEITETEPIVRQHGVALLCRALFNSNEFLFAP